MRNNVNDILASMADRSISNGNGNKIQMVMLFGFIRWINAYSKENSIKT